MTSDTGLPVNLEHMINKSDEILNLINNTIYSDEIVDRNSKDIYKKIPRSFFENNEKMFRNRVNKDHPDIKPLFIELKKSVNELCKVVKQDFLDEEIIYDIYNDLILIKKIPNPDGNSSSSTRKKSKTAKNKAAAIVVEEVVEEDEEEDFRDEESYDDNNTDTDTTTSDDETAAIAAAAGAAAADNTTIPLFNVDNYFHPRDRNKKALPNRFTTVRVENALVQYHTVVENITDTIQRILQGLSEEIALEMPLIILICVWANILKVRNITSYA